MYDPEERKMKPLNPYAEDAEGIVSGNHSNVLPHDGEEVLLWGRHEGVEHDVEDGAGQERREEWFGGIVL